MYTVSNQQMRYIIKFIEIMISAERKTAKTTAEVNSVRMARNLVKTLRGKRPFALDELPEDVQRIVAPK